MSPARRADGRRPPLAAALVLACLVSLVASVPGDTPRGFVARVGAGFVLDGAPFHVVGANQCVPAAGPRGATCAAAREPPAPRLLCCLRAAALQPLRGWWGRTGP